MNCSKSSNLFDAFDGTCLCFKAVWGQGGIEAVDIYFDPDYAMSGWKTDLPTLTDNQLISVKDILDATELISEEKTITIILCGIQTEVPCLRYSVKKKDAQDSD